MDAKDIQIICDSFVQRIKNRLDDATDDTALRIGELLEDQAKLFKKYPDQYKSDDDGITEKESSLVCEILLEPRKDLDNQIQDLVGEETLEELDELSKLLTDCLHVIIACFQRVARKKLSRHDYLFFKVLFPHLQRGANLVRPFQEEDNNPESQDSPRTMRSESQEHDVRD